MIETMDLVKPNADIDCTICDGDGWHWGWEIAHRYSLTQGVYGDRKPIRLRCPCVDVSHQAPHSSSEK